MAFLLAIEAFLMSASTSLFSVIQFMVVVLVVCLVAVVPADD